MGIAVGRGTGRGGMGGTPAPGTIKALVAVMTVCDWIVAGSCGGISWAHMEKWPIHRRSSCFYF